MENAMRTSIALAVVLSLALGATRGAAQERVPKGWVGPFKNLNTPDDAKDTPPAKPSPAKKAEPPKAQEPSLADVAAAAKNREDADLLRRLAVCDKLREIALRTDDNELLQKVDVLLTRARAAYEQRSAMLADVAVPESNSGKRNVSDKDRLLSKKDSSSKVAAKGGQP